MAARSVIVDLESVLVIIIFTPNGYNFGVKVKQDLKCQSLLCCQMCLY